MINEETQNAVRNIANWFAIRMKMEQGTPEHIAHLTLGLTGEAGEVADLIKKSQVTGTLDREALALECADVCMYLSQLCFSADIDLQDAVDRKIDIVYERLKNGSGVNEQKGLELARRQTDVV